MLTGIVRSSLEALTVIVTRDMWAMDSPVKVRNQPAKYQSTTPVNKKHLYNIYAMLDQRRRRWADVV